MNNRILFSGIIALFFMVSCSNAIESSDGMFKLTGHVENPVDVKKVLLYEGEMLVDSALLDAGNQFAFEREVNEPTLYTLLIGFRPYMLILQSGDAVSLKTDLKDGENYQISGSEVSSKLQDLAKIRVQSQKQQNEIQEEFETRTSNGEDATIVQNELMEKSLSAMQKSSEEIFEFSDKNRENLAGLYGMLFLYSSNPTEYEVELIKYSEEAKERFPNNSTAQFFAKHMQELKTLSIGQVAPDFASTTPEGKTVKLSDFRGKYVLLDFWAAWCGPCRQENPNIVAQYHAFKDKGFTVLGVSLDKTKEAWVNAIKNDKLDWVQVSDLKEWDSEAGQLYNITAIPASFLIDPDGKLIAKNLRGPALKQFLEKTLN